MDLSVFFAGTGGSVPTARRGLPSTLIRRGGMQLLFDCGEGTQRQLLKTVGLAELDQVFITHFHADHWLGLPGMLKSFDLRGRKVPLTVYGPTGLRDLMQTMRLIYGRMQYKLYVVELEPWETVQQDGFEIASFPVRHRTAAAYGYALIERERPGHFDPERAAQLGVTPGPDFGRLQRGETVNGVTPDQVMGSTRAGRKVVLSGDTAPCQELAVVAHRADLLVHEATFTEEERDRAIETQHSTARQAAVSALEAEVNMLALTHLSTRYFGREIREEAEQVFEQVVVPRDFDTVEIPFPERGLPTLVSWQERQQRRAEERS